MTDFKLVNTPDMDAVDFFLHGASMRNNERVKALRRKFGTDGYAIWCMLLEKLTSEPGLQLKYADVRDRELLAGDFDIEPRALDSMIQYMKIVGLIRFTQKKYLTTT